MWTRSTNNLRCWAIGLFSFVCSASFVSCTTGTTQKDAVDSLTQESVIKTLQEGASIATTEVTIRKMAVYDSRESDPQLKILDPNTWKIGERTLVVPVTIRITYGYELSKMTIDRVRIEKGGKAAYISLPKPVIVNSGFNAQIDDDEMVEFKSGLRDSFGYSEVQDLMSKCYESVKEKDFASVLAPTIEKNGEKVFGSMVKALGFEEVIINFN